MTFSEKLYISEVEIKEPEDEGEWIKRFSEILLSGLRRDEETNDNPPAQRRLLGGLSQRNGKVNQKNEKKFKDQKN